MHYGFTYIHDSLAYIFRSKILYFEIYLTFCIDIFRDVILPQQRNRLWENCLNVIHQSIFMVNDNDFRRNIWRFHQITTFLKQRKTILFTFIGGIHHNHNRKVLNSLMELR